MDTVGHQGRTEKRTRKNASDDKVGPIYCYFF